MVLESIMNPLRAEKHPLRMFWVGMIYSFIAGLIAHWVFPSHESLVLVFFTVMACAPIMYSTIKLEEKKDLNLDDEVSILREHSKALSFFIMLFLGITFAFSLMYIFLPSDLASSLFSIQQGTIKEINAPVTGQAYSNFNTFSNILLNNVRVLIFCVIFALVYGLGAIFILVWNASVIATAMGEFFRQKISVAASSAGFNLVALYFTTGAHSIARYAIHGVFEILAYFIAGLAGGILSIAIINHDFGTKKFEKVIFDIANLLLIALIILVIGAFLETYVTPMIY